MVAAGAVLIAGKGLFAKALYDMGLSFHDVAAIRSVLAVPGFALLAWLYRGNISRSLDINTHRRDLLLAAAIGLLSALGAGGAGTPADNGGGGTRHWRL